MIELIKQHVEELRDFDGYVKLVSHYDADGLTSAAIMSTALRRNGNDFSMRIVKRIDENLIDEINRERPDFVIFTDIGSSYDLRSLRPKALILDHHKSKKLFGKNVVEINSVEEFGELSGSGVSYLFAKEMNRQNMFLSHLAIAGAIGDIRPIVGMNYNILSDATKLGLITLSKTLNVFGLTTRSIHKSLYLNEILPTINSESSSVQFLSEVGIEVKRNGKWRTLSDLSDEEMQRLASAIIAERIKNGFTNHSEVFSVKMILTSLQMDMSEFATILNAFGRLDKYYEGIKFALNPTKKVAMKIYSEYRTAIGRYMNWVRENVNMEKFTLIDAGDNINPNFIGTICSMLIKSEDIETIIGMANDGNEIKISARSKKHDMSSLITKVVEKIGGEAGGHMEAAGASIPMDKKDDFVRELRQLWAE